MSKEIIIVIIESVVLLLMVGGNVWMTVKRKQCKKKIELELKRKRENALENALINQRRRTN